MYFVAIIMQKKWNYISIRIILWWRTSNNREKRNAWLWGRRSFLKKSSNSSRRGYIGFFQEFSKLTPVTRHRVHFPCKTWNVSKDQVISGKWARVHNDIACYNRFSFFLCPFLTFRLTKDFRIGKYYNL